MKKVIPILIILMVILSLSGCVSAETKEALEEHAKLINEMKEQRIANDISKPYGSIHVTASQDLNGRRNYIVVDGEVEIQNTDSHVIIKVEDGYGMMEFDTRYDDENSAYVNDNLLFSRTFYDMGFNGSKEWYDMILSNELPEYHTIEKEISINFNIGDVVRVGVFNNNWDGSNSAQNIDLYNTQSFLVPISVSGNFGRIKNPVLSFTNTWDMPFEGGESRLVTMERVSGANFNAPYDITSYVMKEHTGNVPLFGEIDGNGDRWINAGWSATYKITFHKIDYTQLTREDVMNVYLDDLNGYKNVDIFKSTKADPVHIARLYSSMNLMEDYDEIIILDDGFIVIKDDIIIQRSSNGVIDQ